MSNKTPLYAALVFSLGLAACDACNSYKLKPVEKSGGVQTKKEAILKKTLVAKVQEEKWEQSKHIPFEENMPRFIEPKRIVNGEFRCPQSYYLGSSVPYDPHEKRYVIKWVCEKFPEEHPPFGLVKRDSVKGIY